MAVPQLAHVLFKSRTVQHLIEELIQNGRKQIKLKRVLTIKDLNDLKAIANQISGPLKFEESPLFETLYATFFHQAGLLTASEVGDDYCGFCGNEATHLCLHLVICPNTTYRNILTEKIVENFIALDEELWKCLKNISIALLKIIKFWFIDESFGFCAGTNAKVRSTSSDIVLGWASGLCTLLA